MEIKYFKKTAFVAMAVIGLASCKKDKTENSKLLRAKIEYSKITDDTKYDNTNTVFVDASGTSTVDLTNGNNRYKMFQAINAYAGLASTTVLDVNVLKNMFSNTSSPFTGTYLPLNGTAVQLKNVVASSLSATDAAAVRTKIEADFATMALISLSSSATASNGVAGKLGTRMVDAKGLETAQIIQKGLIGALQLDYISNVLLNKNLDADNYTLVSGKNYTQLEQNWDEAYAMLTLNPIYLKNTTVTPFVASVDATRATTEFALGSYVWEYGKVADNANFNYTKIAPAFLRGRAAIVNNDIEEVKKQALIIRTTMERAIASAAVGYLGKFGTRNTDADRAHDIGEGGGFIYSLRFCKLNGADATFSDGVLNGLISSTGGFWDITPTKIATATAAIKVKFNLP
jgi:hypothetical protein